MVLTERVDRGRPPQRRGQLPGRRAEPERRRRAATALREAAEEVGLDPVAAGVRVIGALDAVLDPGQRLRA